MVFLSVFGLLIFFGVSLQAMLLGLRDPRQGRRLHSFVWAAGSFTLGSAALASFFYFYEADSSVPLLARAGTILMTFAIIFCIIGAGAWVYFLVRRHVAVRGEERAHHHMPLSQRFKFMYLLAQPGWEKLDSTKYNSEDRQDASSTTRIIGVGATLIVFPAILLLLAASILMNVRGSVTSDFASHTMGYYTLLVATCWTVVYLTTLALVAIQQVLVDQGHDLSPSNVAISVGTWAGLGAAGGVFVGALIPVVVILIPKGPFQSLDVTLMDTISPDLLLNISAAGAVIGFLLGEAVSVTTFAAGEKNLLTQTVAPPLLFGITATILGLAGLRPGAISTYLSRQYKADILHGGGTISDPLATASSADLGTSEGWAALVASLDKHGWNTFVDQHLYFWITWVVVILVVLFSFTINVHHRELKLADMETRGAKKRKKKRPSESKKLPASDLADTPNQTETTSEKSSSDA